MLRGRSFGYLILVAGGLWLGEDSDREGGAGGWCGCGCVAERRRVGVEDGTGLAQWEKDPHPPPPLREHSMGERRETIWTSK